MRRWEKALIVGLLVLSVLLFAYAATGASAYTDPANVTSATLSDTRVNPSQSVTWTPGPVLNATGLPVGGGNSSLSFDAALSQYVTVADDPTLDGIVCFEAWVNPLAYVNHGTGFHVLATKYATYRHGLYLGYNANPNYLAANFYDGVTDSSAAWTLTSYTWLHVVGQLESDGRAHLYVNGVHQAQGVVITGHSGSNADPVRIAGGIVNRYSTAVVDEVRCYNHTLTPTEIAQHAQGIFLNDTGLVLYLDFDGEALDQSGNGNDGTLFNGPTYVDGWASVPVSTYYNGSISVNSRRILVNSTDGTTLSTVPDTAPTPIGTYNDTIAPDNSIGNGTITGFIVDRYEVYLEAQYEETEAGFSTLLTAQGSSAVDGHALGLGDSFTIDGIAFTWNTYTSNFTATDSKATPQTVTYGTAITGSEATYGITNFSANNTATVTWITGTLDRLQSWFVTGDWIGAAFSELFLVTGQVAGYTLILGIFSIAVYQYSGPYATFAVWLFGWAVFIPLVHGVAQQMAILLFAVGVGLALAKLINDRRNA